MEMYSPNASIADLHGGRCRISRYSVLADRAAQSRSSSRMPSLRIRLASLRICRSLVTKLHEEETAKQRGPFVVGV